MSEPWTDERENALRKRLPTPGSWMYAEYYYLRDLRDMLATLDTLRQRLAEVLHAARDFAKDQNAFDNHFADVLLGR